MTASRSDLRKSDFYEVEPGVFFPRVTALLDVINKPFVNRWSVNREREMVSGAAADFHLDLMSAVDCPKTKLAYLTMLEARLGKTKAGEKISQKARDIGTEIHNLIKWETHRMLGHEPGPMPEGRPEAIRGYTAWREWANRVSFKPLLVEQRVIHMEEQYAGTMDLYAKIEGIPTLVDYKSSKAVYSESFLQNAAYQKALVAMGHGSPERGLIVRLPKEQGDPGLDPDYFMKKCVVPVPDVNALYPVFLAVKALWLWQHSLDQPSVDASAPAAPPVAEDPFAAAFAGGSAKGARS